MKNIYEDILAQSIVLLAEDAPEYFAAPVSPPYGKEETMCASPDARHSLNFWTSFRHEFDMKYTMQYLYVFDSCCF